MYWLDENDKSLDKHWNEMKGTSQSRDETDMDGVKSNSLFLDKLVVWDCLPFILLILDIFPSIMVVKFPIIQSSY